jgi:predicted DNA-binding transcriptional regulator AlpA
MSTGACEQIKSDSPYLTPFQVAEILQISVKSVYRYAKDDPTFPTLRIDGVVRFPRERLERWLHEREQGRGCVHRISNQVLPRRNSVPA